MTEPTIQERLRKCVPDCQCHFCKLRYQAADHIDAVEADATNATARVHELEEQVQQLKDEVLRKQHTIQALADTNTEIKYQLYDCKQHSREIEYELTAAKKELKDGGNEDFRTIKEVTAENVALKKKVQELHNEKCGLLRELETLGTWKRTVMDRDVELGNLRDQLRKWQKTADERGMRVLELEASVTTLKEAHKQRVEENDIVMDCNARFEEDLKKQRDELRISEGHNRTLKQSLDIAHREEREAREELAKHPQFQHLNARNKALARKVKGMRKHARETGAWFGKTLARDQELWEKGTSEMRDEFQSKLTVAEEDNQRLRSTTTKFIDEYLTYNSGTDALCRICHGGPGKHYDDCGLVKFMEAIK